MTPAQERLFRAARAIDAYVGSTDEQNRDRKPRLVPKALLDDLSDALYGVEVEERDELRKGPPPRTD